MVFSGNILPGRDMDHVRKNLAVLFKTDIKKIEAVFSGPDAVVKRDVDFETGSKYVKIIESAGAECRLEPVRPERESPVPQPRRDRPAERQAAAPHVFKIKAGAASFAFSPLACNRLTACDNGINLNRTEVEEVLFTDIETIGITLEEKIQKYRLFLFVRGFGRPFVVDDHMIVYSQFAVPRGIKASESLRYFMQYLLMNNSSIAMDEKTHDFVFTGMKNVYTLDDVIFSTALANASGHSRQERPSDLPDGEKPAMKGPLVQGAAPKIKTPREKAERTLRVLMNRYRFSDNADMDIVRSLFDLQSRRYALIFSIFLIAGAAWPLMKFSPDLGVSVLVWPWHLMGIGIDRYVRSVLGMTGSSIRFAMWAMLPVIAGVTVLSCRNLGLKIRSIIMLLAGLVLTVLIFTVFFKEGRVFAIAIFPLKLKAGIMVTLFIISISLAASSIHLRQVFPGSMVLRSVTLFGGLVILALIIVTLLKGSGVWKKWPVMAMYLALFSYSILGGISAFMPAITDSMASFFRLFLRGILCWLFLAMIIVQMKILALTGLQPGPGLMHVTVASLKVAFLVYGSAFLMGAGLTGIFSAFLSERVRAAL